MHETWVRSLVRKIPWRRKWQPTPVFLPGESQGQGSLVGCPLWVCIELDTTLVTALAAAEKATSPFRYDLNQIPYDYTVEVKNRFKGFNLIECLMNN